MADIPAPKPRRPAPPKPARVRRVHLKKPRAPFLPKAPHPSGWLARHQAKGR